MPHNITLKARYLFTGTGNVIANGMLVYDDSNAKIIAIETSGTRTADIDLGNMALLPGLVNAHTHLDLSGANGATPVNPGDPFPEWLKRVIQFRTERTPEQVEQDIQFGINECIKSGTTLIGDISAFGKSYPLLQSSPLQANLYWEIIGLNEQRFQQRFDEFIAFANNHPETDSLRWRLSLHAPYTVNHRLALKTLAQHHTAMHLAESRDELQLLNQHQGAFVHFLKSMNLWDESNISATVSDFLKASNGGNLWVHANEFSLSETIHPSDSVVYCPRTHAAFHHPPHPFRNLLSRGVNVCLGTDSLATNPDLDIFAEACFLKQKYDDLDGESLLKMITVNGAKALGWADQCGQLTPGYNADAVAIPLPNSDGDPYELLFKADPTQPRHRLFKGQFKPDFHKHEM